MKFLKILGIIILVVIILLLCIAAFLPQSNYFEVSRVVPADPVSCYSQVANLSNWEEWSPWKEMDPEVKLKYFQSIANEDSAFTWNGPLAGTGTVSISEKSPYTQVKLNLNIGGKYTAFAVYSFKAVPEGTLITGTMKMNDLSYPMGRWMGLLTPSMLKPAFRKSLENLEIILIK